jgi:hypothetical protein
MSLGILKAIIPPTHAAETRGSGNIADYARKFRAMKVEFGPPWPCRQRLVPRPLQARRL